MNLWPAIAEFLLDRRSFGRARATIRFYQTHLYAMAEFMEQRSIVRVDGISSSTLRAWFAYLHSTDISHNTIAAYDRAARAFFAFCRQEGWLDPDPMAARPRIRQEKHRPDTLDLDEVRALLDTCDDDVYGIRDRAIMLLMLDTGMRAGELVGLNLDDLDLNRRSGHAYIRAQTSKSRRGRLVLFQEQTTTAIRAWFQVRPDIPGPVFLAADGVNLGERPLTPGGLNQLMRRRARQAGLEDDHNRWCHIWRHTFARCYVMRGGDLETLRRLLGHSSLETVRVYLDFRTEDLDEKHARLSPVRQLFSES